MCCICVLVLCVCACLCVHVHTSVCTCICTYGLYICMCEYVCLYVYMCIHMSMCLCVHVCVCVPCVVLWPLSRLHSVQLPPQQVQSCRPREPPAALWTCAPPAPAPAPPVPSPRMVSLKRGHRPETLSRSSPPAGSPGDAAKVRRGHRLLPWTPRVSWGLDGPWLFLYPRF